MGNTHAKPHPRPRNKKQVHWKAADRPSPPGKPRLGSDNDLTPDLVTILWTKPVRDGGSPITGYLVEHRRTGSPHWVRATPLLVPFPELTISGLEPGWRYQFRVRAENAVGLSDPSEISEPLTVTLQKYAITAPKFTEELKDITVLENEKVECVVHFLGQPPPKICWYKDGFEIFSSRRTRILTENDKSILTIHQSALSDEGEIKCTATNKAGHASTKARLTLEAPPSIRLPRQYEDGLLFEIGEMIRLKVSVAGRPTPLIFWSHNGESIQNNDRYEVEYVDKSSILKLGEARRSDRGEYQIKAVNKIGEDVASFLVTITDKPSPPGKARVVMTLGRSVTLSWNTPEDDGGCKIGNYIVEYYRLGWNVWLKAATSRQLTTILGDLIEGSEYKFRIKAESPYGVSDPGEESDIVFIPDPKRGITSPQARSKSQPKDIIDEITAPVATKRKSKQARSQSSTAKVEAMANYFEEEMPKRPERSKIKSPPKTPELSPTSSRKEVNQQTIIDRESLARELAYGSPEIKLTKAELDIPELSYKAKTPERSPNDRTTLTVQNKQIKSRSPSPIPKSPSPQSKTSTPSSKQSHSPEEKKTPSPKNQRILREKSEEESSEFMLVLYPDANEKGQKRDIEFDFDEYEIPPPLSLSAPELGVEPPIFENLKPSASSTELLHERAMMRFNEAAAAEEAELNKYRKFSYDGQRNIDIPKIQINSKDDQDIVGLERKASRRRSSGSIVQQQVLWAQRRFSLTKSGDLNDLVDPKRQQSPKQSNGDLPQKEPLITRQRSESEEREEAEFEKVRTRMALQGQSSFEKKTIEVVDEDKWLEDYEESLSESESESESEDERKYDEPPVPRVYSDEEEEVYHPGIMTGGTLRRPVSDEPFEILTRRNKLPDPNFVPKPILKKTDDRPDTKDVPTKVPKETPLSKTRSHSPRPQFRQPQDVVARERSQSLAQPNIPPPVNNKVFQRSLSLSVPEEIKPPEQSLMSTMSITPGHNISAVATLCGITAASIVIPEELYRKKRDEEEARVVVDHYMDIVKNYGRKKSSAAPAAPSQSMWRTQSSLDQKDTIDSSSQPSWKNQSTLEKKDLPEPLPQQRKPSIKEEKEHPSLQQRRPSWKEETEQPPFQQRKPSWKSQVAVDAREPFYLSYSPPEKESTPPKEEPSITLAAFSGEVAPKRQERAVSPTPQRRSPTPQRTPTPQRGRSINHGPRKASRSKTPQKSSLENWSGRTQRKSSPSPMKRNTSVRKSPSPSPIPYSKPRPKLKEIMTQTSIGLELNYSSDSRTSTPSAKRQEELLARAEVKVRSFVDYLTDLAMFTVACWLYLFSNELLAIPVLFFMVYRQLKNEVRKRIPKWIIRRFNKTKTKN